MTAAPRFDAPFLAAVAARTEGNPAGDRVITDSREDVAGAVFVALPGDRFDGHDFVVDVLARGAGAAMVSRAWREAHPEVAGPLVVVDDTLDALQRLAARHRERVAVPLVAVTGSNGKTTVKELLAAALSSMGPVLRTRGNRNNHIGLPLTLLELERRHAAAVCEMGMNHPGELRLLSGLARPQVAVITCVALAHLEGVGDRAGVARAKAEIADGLAADGVLVVPHGDPDLEAALAGRRGATVRFGVAPQADFRPASVEALPDGRRRLRFADGIAVETPSPGAHMVANVLCALAAARALGAGPAEAALGLAGAPAVPGRMEVKRAGEVTVIDDSYNANPGSLAAATAALRDWPGATRRLAVIGDMLELGAAGPALHAAAGAELAFLDRLVTVGPLSARLGEGAVAAGLDRVRWTEAPDGAAAATLLAGELRGGDVVLVKGSRGIHLETAVRGILEGAGGIG